MPTQPEPAGHCEISSCVSSQGEGPLLLPSWWETEASLGGPLTLGRSPCWGGRGKEQLILSSHSTSVRSGPVPRVSSGVRGRSLLEVCGRGRGWRSCLVGTV